MHGQLNLKKVRLFNNHKKKRTDFQLQFYFSGIFQDLMLRL